MPKQKPKTIQPDAAAIGQLNRAEFAALNGGDDADAYAAHLRACISAKAAVMAGLYERAGQGDNAAAKQYLDNALELEE